ncbi:hypothetical protein AKJ09_09246 [Labilithrix luteola]|uniref:Uncharacterized protein n=1 Tax=Labilithrix luteola TaxID=1391654 RepID=A0A0K1QA17_9BACT|nr:hypothetical protein AKJ09_09246 [Labilithrix luteola]
MKDVARVARLRAHGIVLGLGLDDAEVVARAHAELPVPAEQKLPMQTFGLVAVILATMGCAIGVRIATKPFDAAGSGLGKAFAQNFGTHVASVANGSRPNAETAVKHVFPARTLTPPADRAMTELFAAQVAAAGDPGRMPVVFEKTRNVNAAFATLGQPWYLDARYYHEAPLLYAFYREREDEGTAEKYAPERIVYLWRLDRLNISKAALGYTHRDADAALVLYDQIEELLIRDVLPALAEGEKLDFIDTASRDPKKAWQEDVEMRAARMVRESFATAANHDDLVELGTLLAKRRALVKRWQADLSSQGRILREPNRLVPEADYVADLWHLVPSSTRHEWEDVHERLLSTRMTTTFEALRDRFAADIARHELQHRFDGQRTKECDGETPCAKMLIPAAVKNRVGPKDEAPVLLGSLPARVRNETSAYLAQMASPSSMPKMAILSLLRTVLDREAWGDVYCNTTIVLLDVLASEFGLVDEAMPLVAGGAVQRASVASLVAVLFAKPDDELRAGAGKKWRELYGEELPLAVITPGHQAKRWRH